MTRAKISETVTPQERYFSLQKDEGMIRVTAWVPEADRIDLLNHAKELREAFMRDSG